MGLLTGFLSGISATPIVSVVIPLIFTLATAGGGFYIIWGRHEGDESVSKRDRHVRARFLGIQMAAFAPCFIIGLWGGVYVKFNSDRIWSQHSESPVYPRFSTSDPSLLLYLRSVDATLLRDGVSVADRIKILQALYDNRENWKDHADKFARERKLPEPEPKGTEDDSFRLFSSPFITGRPPPVSSDP